MEYHSTEQTIGWLQGRYREGALEIKPSYQRNPVWSARQRCSLIESILMSLPVPEVFLQCVTDAEGKTNYAVVDGQQRIRTILLFTGANISPDQEDDSKFALDRLSPTSDWYQMGFDDLPEAKKIALFEYKLAIRELRTGDPDDIRSMFTRLNRFLTPLNPQELRNARYSGPFIQLANRLADESYFAENRILAASFIRRMGDIQFISELLIGVMHGPQGGSAKVVDEYYAQYEDCEDEFPNQRQTSRLYQRTLALIQDYLPDIRDTRWSNRTDFYSLFVASAQVLRLHKPADVARENLPAALTGFGDEVERRIANPGETVSGPAAKYARAAVKGVNDKVRRAERHQALLELLEPFFE